MKTRLLFSRCVAFCLLGLMLGCTALCRASEVVAWPQWCCHYDEAIVPPGLTNAVFIAAGGSNSLVITSAGRLVVWGYGGYGLTTVPLSATNVVAASVGNFHNLAVNADGRVMAWGQGTSGKTNVPANLSNVVAVAAGGEHSLALTADMRVVAWGGGPGTLVPPGLSNVVAIAAGTLHGLALLGTGEVISWGQYPPLFSASNVLFLMSSIDQGMILTADGQRMTDTYCCYHNTRVLPPLSNVVAIAVSDAYAMSLTGDGNVSTQGPFTPYDEDQPNLSNVVAIAAGTYHRMALIDSVTLQSPKQKIKIGVVTNGTAISVPTLRGRGYVLESKSSLSNAQWIVQQRFAGDGTVRQFTIPSQGQAFYRARRVQ